MQLTCNMIRYRAVATFVASPMILAVASAVFFQPCARAGEGPFFVSYTHQMEEPGNLEVTTKNITGKPGDGNRFLGCALEFEYGVKGWWTSSPATGGKTGFECSLVNTGSTLFCM